MLGAKFTLGEKHLAGQFCKSCKFKGLGNSASLQNWHSSRFGTFLPHNTCPYWKYRLRFRECLIAQMLKSARDAGGGMKGDADEQDETNSTVVELEEKQLAQVLSNNGGLGIANMVVAGMVNHANR
jgi:hypothetical protein